MTEEIKTCPRCGDLYPADLDQKFWLGPDTCDPCQHRAKEAFIRWKRGCMEAEGHDRATSPRRVPGNTA